MKGRVQLDNIILRCEDAPSISPARMQFEDWPSYDGNFQIGTIPSFKEVQFKTSVVTDRENLLKALNGKTVVASSDFFDTFECVVKTEKYGLSAGKTRAIYDITLREDSSIVPK